MKHDGLTLNVELLTDGGTIITVTMDRTHLGTVMVNPAAEVSFVGQTDDSLPLGDKDAEMIDTLIHAARARTGAVPAERRRRRRPTPSQRRTNDRFALGLSLGIAASGGGGS